MQIILRAEAKTLGLKRYYTGKECKNGHIAERQTSDGCCLDCSKIKVAKWQSENKNYLIKYEKERYALNAEYFKQKSSEWRNNNRDKHLEYLKQYFKSYAGKLSVKKYKLKNRDELLIKQRKYYNSSPLSKSTWIAKNRNIVNSYAAKRRAFKKQSIPQWANIDAIKDVYKNCPIGYEVDHIVPIQSDLVCGLHYEVNLQYLTKQDNRSKSNYHWPDMP